MKKNKGTCKSKHRHAAFFLGACHRVVNSTFINIIFAVIGFIIGCTSVLLTYHIQQHRTYAAVAEKRISHYVNKCRTANEELVHCVNELIRNTTSIKTNDCVFR